MQAITLAKNRKTGKWVVLASPDQEYSEHAAIYAKLAQGGDVNEDWSAVTTGHIYEQNATLIFSTADEKKAAQEKISAGQARISKGHIDSRVREAEHIAKDRAAKQARHEAEVARLNRAHGSIRNRTASPQQIDAVEAIEQAKRDAEATEKAKAELAAIEQAKSVAAAEQAKREAAAAAEKAKRDAAAGEQAKINSTTTTENPTSANDSQRRTELERLKVNDLFEFIDANNEDAAKKKIEVSRTAKKTELVEAILAHESAPAA